MAKLIQLLKTTLSLVEDLLLFDHGVPPGLRLYIGDNISRLVEGVSKAVVEMKKLSREVSQLSN
jgi:hypothetical protein